MSHSVRTCSFRWIRTLGGAVVLAMLLQACPSHAVPAGPGLTIAIHDSLPDPLGLTFGTDGALYVGRDNSGSGGGNADSVRIHRIAPGGGSHIQYGARATWDPDVLIFDAAGTYSGVAGSVIVGGRPTGSATGVISAIRPDQSVVTLAGPSAGFVNPSNFAIDNSGRLLFTDFEGTGAVQQMTGGAPTPFFSPGTGNRDIVVHPTTGEIYLRNSTANTIKRYSSTGTLLATVATGIAGTGMGFGTGGIWGTSLYVTSGTRILRVNSATSRDTVASGFSNVVDLEFGPGGAMYVSDFAADKVYRLSAATAGVDGIARVDGVRLTVSGAQPSRGETRLQYSIPHPGHAKVEVLDVAGRVVTTLQEGVMPAGEHEVRWDGHDAGGRSAAPGVYLARVVTSAGVASTRIVRVR